MEKINLKSLILAFILGFLSWLWAFIIVGSAFFDYTTNKPIKNPSMSVYITMLIINIILTIAVLILYLWKYEQNHPIFENNWVIDALILGAIICGLNFLLDAIFFGMMGRNLLAYFFLETSTGYLYPLIIVETIVFAYLIYGKKK
ncbi:MAG: hypothetical protein ACP6IY_20165 [Promethearchaeia archaeon]